MKDYKIRTYRVAVFVFIISLFSSVYAVAGFDGFVLQVQKKLTEIGYDPGPIDGFWGDKTKSAIEKYQKDKGLTVTGKIDQETRSKLDIKPKKLEKVSISYTSFVSGFNVRGKDGRLGPPEKKVVFGDNTRKTHTLTAKAVGKTIICPVAWQDVAYFLDNKGQRENRFLIFGYEGCPFAIEGDLEVNKGVEMREQTIIEIDSATGNILWVSPKSARPLALLRGRLSSGVEMIGNMVWVFKKKGISFSSKTNAYKVEKNGGKISFTKNGVVFDGVRTLSKK